MFFIDTEQLRKRADNLREQSKRCMQSIAALEEVLAWMQKTEFQDAESIAKTMKQQREALEEQKKEMLLLSEGLLRICEKYDSAEQKILDAAEKSPDISGYIGKVDLDYIKKMVPLYGNLHVV